MILLMAEIRRSPVDIVVFSHYSHGFIHPFGGCLEFLNHQTVSLAAIVIMGNLKPAEVPAKTIDHMTRLESFKSHQVQESINASIRKLTAGGPPATSHHQEYSISF